MLTDEDISRLRLERTAAQLHVAADEMSLIATQYQLGQSKKRLRNIEALLQAQGIEL